MLKPALPAAAKRDVPRCAMPMGRAIGINDLYRVMCYVISFLDLELSECVTCQ